MYWCRCVLRNNKRRIERSCSDQQNTAFEHESHWQINSKIWCWSLWFSTGENQLPVSAKLYMLIISYVYLLYLGSIVLLFMLMSIVFCATHVVNNATKSHRIYTPLRGPMANKIYLTTYAYVLLLQQNQTVTVLKYANEL